MLTDPLFYISLALIGLHFYMEWYRAKERGAAREERSRMTEKIMAKNLQEYTVHRQVEEKAEHQPIPGSDKWEAEVERRRGG